ncbi:MAG: hypothetical protein ACJ8F1_08905 [Polyangia bacterium]|jgi:hypothetical protein
MRPNQCRAAHAVFVAALMTAGCGSNTTASSNSFTRVYAEVIQPSCTNDFCHFNTVSIRYSALDLSSKTRAYWSLVGLPCMGPACSQIGTRVVPWDPDQSVMYRKLSPTPPCGVQMPADKTTFSTNGTSELKFSGVQLPGDQQQLIYSWIVEGAQNN